MTYVAPRVPSSADSTLPKAEPVGPVDAARVAGASLGVLVLAGLAVVAVRALPASSWWSTIVAAAVGAALVPMVASVLEWFVHRFVYHQAVLAPLRAIFTVHTAHHYAFFPTWRYTTSGPARRLSIRLRTPDIHAAAWRNAGVRAAHFGWYMAIGVMVIWIPAWLLTADVAFLAGIVVASMVVSNLFIVVHDTIHRPGSHRLVEAQPWFAFLDRHHYIHHVSLGANLNFLLPLGDLLFGTLRTELTASELERHGPLDAAKVRPLGVGERARAVIG
jgi:multisubunit Na+/H+ antiporter MnhB subunit